MNIIIYVENLWNSKKHKKQILKDNRLKPTMQTTARHTFHHHITALQIN